MRAARDSIIEFEARGADAGRPSQLSSGWWRRIFPTPPPDTCPPLPQPSFFTVGRHRPALSEGRSCGRTGVKLAAASPEAAAKRKGRCAKLSPRPMGRSRLWAARSAEMPPKFLSFSWRYLRMKVFLVRSSRPLPAAPPPIRPGRRVGRADQRLPDCAGRVSAGALRRSDRPARSRSRRPERRGRGARQDSGGGGGLCRRSATLALSRNRLVGGRRSCPPTRQPDEPRGDAGARPRHSDDRAAR